MTTIRVNFHSGSGTTIDPTFNQFNDSSIGVKSSDLLDIAGASTGVGLESLGGFTGQSGGTGQFTSGVDVFPPDVFDFFWYSTSTATIKFTGLPASTVVQVKGVGANASQPTRDTTWTIDAQSQDYDAGGGTSAPNPPVDFTTTQSNASGELEIDLDINLFQAYLGGLELQFTALGVVTDTTTNFNSTLNYTTSGLGTITSATLEDSEGNVMSLTSVTNTTAVVPDYGVGQRCLTGVVNLTVSDGTSSASASLTLLPKTGYSSVSLETGFTKNQGDWTYGWDEITFNPPVVGTEGHWTHPTIIYLGDGSVVGVTEATTVNSYVIDPTDGFMATQAVVFQLDSGSVEIPSGSRDTYQAIEEYLVSTGSFTSDQNNDIIVEWLKSEGITGSQFNDLFYNYWGQKGFTGAYNDRWKKWKNS